MTSLIFHRAMALWSLQDLIWLSCWLLGCVTETLSQQQDTSCNRKHWDGAVVLTDTSRLVLVTGFKPKTLCEWQKASMFDCSLERKPCHTRVSDWAWTHSGPATWTGLWSWVTQMCEGVSPNMQHKLFHQREKSVWVTFVFLEQQMEQNVRKDGGL